MKTFRVLVIAGVLSTGAAAGTQDDVLGGFTREDTRNTQHLPGYSVLPATIVKLGARRNNGWFVVTLDNGQVWSQTETRPDALVRVGDNITLRKARLGSYTLRTVEGIDTRVKRDR